MLSPGIRSTIVVIFKGIFVASSEIFPECLKGFFFFFARSQNGFIKPAQLFAHFLCFLCLLLFLFSSL